MLIVTKKLTRTGAVVSVLLLGAVLAGAILTVGSCERRKAAPSAVPMESNAQRVAYLTGLGWKVAEEAVETLDLQLPESLAGTEYEAYNDLQTAQGFDLSDDCGKAVTRYTYQVLNYPDVPEGVQANLYCREGVLIAGDVISTGEAGFTAPLAYPKANP